MLGRASRLAVGARARTWRRQVGDGRKRRDAKGSRVGASSGRQLEGVTQSYASVTPLRTVVGVVSVEGLNRAALIVLSHRHRSSLRSTPLLVSPSLNMSASKPFLQAITSRRSIYKLNKNLPSGVTEAAIGDLVRETIKQTPSSARSFPSPLSSLWVIRF